MLKLSRAKPGNPASFIISMYTEQESRTYSTIFDTEWDLRPIGR